MKETERKQRARNKEQRIKRIERERERKLLFSSYQGISYAWIKIIQGMRKRKSYRAREESSAIGRRGECIIRKEKKMNNTVKK